MYSWLSLLALGALTFLLVKGAFGVMVKERESALRVRTLEEESTKIDSRETELREEMARLQTEEGILEEIRDKFSVTREGEYVAIIVDEKRAATTTELSTGERLRDWWQGLLDWWRN